MTPDEKLCELIVYILLRLTTPNKKNDEGLELVQQIAFEADYVADINMGTPLTSYVYRIIDGKPCPENYNAFLDTIETAGIINRPELSSVDYGTFAERQTMHPFVFTNEQQQIINDVIADILRGLNDEDLRTYSLTGYESVPENGIIPYGSVSFA